MNNKKAITFLGGFLIILAIASGINKTTNKAEVSPLPQKEPEEQVLGEESVTIIRYEGRDGIDAQTLLEETAEIKYEAYDPGNLITEINGQKNSGKKFWLFYVNGQLANTSADNYLTKDGDLIEWRYEEIE